MFRAYIVLYFNDVFNIPSKQRKGRKGNGFCTKVFWVFDFGHFFCPFLKRGFTFVKKRCKISLVTIMLSFLFFNKKNREHKIFHFFKKVFKKNIPFFRKADDG
jgi:hypothetical protein